MNRNELESRYKCRQDKDYNTDENSGNYKGLYMMGCREHLNAELDEFVNIFSIAGIVIGSLFLLVAIFAACVCCCPAQSLILVKGWSND